MSDEGNDRALPRHQRRRLGGGAQARRRSQPRGADPLSQRLLSRGASRSRRPRRARRRRRSGTARAWSSWARGSPGVPRRPVEKRRAAFVLYGRERRELDLSCLWCAVLRRRCSRRARHRQLSRLPRRARPARARSAIDRPRPPRFSLDEHDGRMVIEWRWFRAKNLAMIPFAALLVPGFLFFWYQRALTNPRHAELPLLFPLLHVGVGLWLVYRIATNLVNRTRIVADDGGIDHARAAAGAKPSASSARRWRSSSARPCAAAAAATASRSPPSTARASACASSATSLTLTRR